MRVLHLISSSGMYGAEAVILNLSAALNSMQGNSSMMGVFANSAQPNPQLHQAAAKAGIESQLIPCRGQLDFSVVGALRMLEQSSKADVIHAHGYKADVYAWMALRGRAPLVSTCHTWYDNDIAVRIYGAIDRRILRSFVGVVAVSEQVRKRLSDAGVRPERTHLIRNGIDINTFAAAASIRVEHRESNAPLRIGLVGRLSREKGVDLYTRAAAEVLRRFPATQFLVAGDGPDRAQLEALRAELNLQNSVTLLGRTEDMLGFYSSIDVLVSASREEGLPIALLEGMASGLPVVATRVGAIPQLIRDGETGALVNAGDTDALATAICALIQNPELRDRLGRAAQDHVRRNFSAERMCADYLELYRNVLAQRSSATQ